MGRISTPAMLIAVDSCLLIAAMKRNIAPIIKMVVQVNSRKVKYGPGSRLRSAKKYKLVLNSETLISFIGHVVTREDIASIPG
jgi:hypothetical protein